MVSYYKMVSPQNGDTQSGPKIILEKLNSIQ